MYNIFNEVESKIIFESISDAEFTHFMRKIAVENDDEDLSIVCVSEAKEYLEIYCDNLKLIH